MNYFSVKNLEKYQHYTDRCPPWIKLHRTIFDDYEFSCLQDASKLQLILIFLLASQMDNRVPCDENWLKNKLGVKSRVDLQPFIEQGFILLDQDASNTLADCKQNGVTEKRQRRDREEAEQRQIGVATSILQSLNKQANKNWKPVKKNLGFILARLEEHSVEELEYAIKVKVAEWKGDPKMDKYLRPSTLFNAEKCETYINQKMGLKAKTKTRTKLEEIGAWGNESDEEDVQKCDGDIIDIGSGDRPGQDEQPVAIAERSAGGKL